MNLGDKPFAMFDRAVEPALGAVSAVVLFSMMALTCTDVIGRYFFNQPIYGAFEITEMALALLIFAGLPLVTLRNDHVTVDVLDSVTPGWLLRLQYAAACAVAFVSTGYLAWRLWLRADTLLGAGETTAQLKFKLAWLTYAMSLLMALTAIAFLILAFRPARRAVQGDGSGGQGLGP